MASLTINLDAELLQAAKTEAERRHTSVDQLVAEYLASVAKRPSQEDVRAFIEWMNRGPLGDLGELPTREEIYAERTWPRS